jgi:hypothetical protein
MTGCHVAAHGWATWHHTTCQNNDTCQHWIHPLVCHKACLVSMPTHLPHHYMVIWTTTYIHLPHHHYTDCMDCTVSKILPVWKNEQNMISHSYDICLNPFKLCWDREDKAYTCVHFEAIPRTFIFEQNLIPWITPPHWEAFGPPKDYF